MSLEVFQERVEKDLVKFYSSIEHTRPGNNLNIPERIALRELSDTHDIVIRQADKGGAIIIMDSEIYRQENLKLLSDSNTYRRLTSNPTFEFRTVLSRHIERGIISGVLNRKQADFLICEFHSLHKIHKPGFPPPFRPIVAGIGSLNEGLCSWVDNFLQPLVHHIPGYLQNSRDVLRAFDDFTWDDDMLWVTVDAMSLYTVIPHDLALIALDWFLNTHGGYSASLMEYFILSVEYLLKYNFFVFDHQYYLQITGTSMGAKFSTFTGECVYVMVGKQVSLQPLQYICIRPCAGFPDILTIYCLS